MNAIPPSRGPFSLPNLHRVLFVSLVLVAVPFAACEPVRLGAKARALMLLGYEPTSGRLAARHYPDPTCPAGAPACPNWSYDDQWRAWQAGRPTIKEVPQL